MDEKCKKPIESNMIDGECKNWTYDGIEKYENQDWGDECIESYICLVCNAGKDQQVACED